MLTVFCALAVIAVLGASLRHWATGLDVDAARRQCGALVLNVCLPALNLLVIYRSDLGDHLWQVPLVMLASVVVCVGVAMLVFSVFSMDVGLKNALILGCAFGNVTYLGLPLLRGLFPGQVGLATEIAILCEITVTSLDLITGTLLAAVSAKANEHASVKAVVMRLVQIPLLWSVAIAALIRVLGISLPEFVLLALNLLGEVTSGLMLLVLGMAIKPAAMVAAVRQFGTWWPILPIKLGLSPLVVLFAGTALGLSTLSLQATVLEAAMPPQLFILIVAERLGFDTGMLAAAIACLTVISFLTLPVVHLLMG